MDLDVSEYLPLLGLSHAEIAERTGTTRGYVQQVSAGNRKVGRKHAAAFARLFRDRAESNAAALRAAADALDPPAAAHLPPPTPEPPPLVAGPLCKQCGKNPVHPLVRGPYCSAVCREISKHQRLAAAGLPLEKSARAKVRAERQPPAPSPEPAE